MDAKYFFSEDCGCPEGYSSLNYAESNNSLTCGGGSILLFMAVLQNFINGRCDLADPCNRIKHKEQPDYEYDFVVIGGGTAGSVIASRLSENPSWKVLLIEAGLDEPPGTSVPSLISSYIASPDLDWKYYTEPEENACLGEFEQRCFWPRGKVLGGCSTINGMMYLRGHKRDYDDWVKSGCENWSWDEVLPFFKVSQDNRQIGSLVTSRHHKRGGYLTVQQFRHRPTFAEDLIKAAEEIGYGTSLDLNGDNYKGFTIAQALNRNGVRLSTSRAFLRPVSHRKNLHVMLNSTVTKILIHKDSKAVYGVKFVHKNLEHVVKINKEVILSAGALNSPQILLLSGVGPEKDLKNLGIDLIMNLEGVGNNLHNHVATFVKFNLEKSFATQQLDWPSVVEYAINRSGKMSSTGLSQVTGIVNSKYADPSGSHPDVQYFFRGFQASCSRTGEIGEVNDPNNPNTTASFVISPVILHPKSRGHLKLSSKDPLKPPLMYPRYFSQSEDVDTLVDAVKMALRFADSKLMIDKWGIKVDKTPIERCLKFGEWGSDDYWKCYVKVATGPENHQVGTCKMGSLEDPTSVVDSQLRVKGVKGLRVMDASVIPIIPSSNTAAPVIMIAERGSHFVKTAWSSNKPPSAFKL